VDAVAGQGDQLDVAVGTAQRGLGHGGHGRVLQAVEHVVVEDPRRR